MNLKANNFLYGIILGIAIPLVSFGIVSLIQHLFSLSLRQSTMELVALAIVLPVFRYFIVNLGAEKTGKGMLLVIFAYALYFSGRHFGLF